MITPTVLQEIEQIIYRYSYAMDTSQWDEMDKLFTPDARIVLGDQSLPYADGIALFRRCMECCSQTHHVNSNILVLSATETKIRTVTNVISFHRGRDARSEETLETRGTYTDEFHWGPDGWRIAERADAAPIASTDIAAFFSDALSPG